MKSKRNTFAFILVIIGVILLIRAIDPFFFGDDVFKFLLPIGLIVLGIWLIQKKKKKSDNFKNSGIHINIDSDSDNNSFNNKKYYSSFASAKDNASQKSGTFTEAPGFSEQGQTIGVDGRIRYSKVLGDMFIDCTGMNMQNVEVSAGIGDVEIKVHGGILNDGLNRMVVSGFIGDCRIMIPPDTEMFTHCSNFIGDIEVLGRRASGFGNNVDAQTANYNAAPKRLYIAANNFIGDIKIMII